MEGEAHGCERCTSGVTKGGRPHILVSTALWCGVSASCRKSVRRATVTTALLGVVRQWRLQRNYLCLRFFHGGWASEHLVQSVQVAATVASATD